MRKRSLSISSLLAILIAAASLSNTAFAAEEVNLYSARKEALIKPLLDRFSAQTDIQVNLVTGKADALLKRLQLEGRNSPADLLITTDAGRLYRAKSAGVTQSVSSVKLRDTIPAAYRDPEGHWFGLSLRARPIIYVKGKVSADELSTYEALADPKWAKKICIRSSGNIYNQSLVASMLSHDGKDETQVWADSLVKNLARKPKGGDRDQIKAAAAGQCDIAIANTYYLGKMIKGKGQSQQAAAEKVAIFWPNQSDRGAHVNISGVTLTRAAKNRANAIRLMEFLVTPESQSWYAEANHEYPVREGVEWSDLLKQWGGFKADQLNLAKLGQYNATAVRIMDRAGWK
ncbi:MAG: Fe(3+) ABC transporter substrate-binding protein [endosymbiont of Seepiophila jonesi]|uniref:Fe(3+) ABC transporter substrate-binding protein n=1 Tax=endosymbiont of Lamellibrachia luymesi TaxID=2200907 RepID=A0A370DZ98_9GAMM|nr:MAG: Fe(3+) ABC transporter substrate-binding protein [endosymbiont of Seepiophila jonesi]RDH91938.1 MAG: Fe(3+) ABC transporter substrate-binding protein [endosymbiont of Lamellibrachia luymesi]